MAKEGYLLAAALDYARQGIAVFPLEENAKNPATGHGYKDATTDEGMIRAWWGRSPNANIGMPTGAILGAFVVDLDPGHGGDLEWALLTAAHGDPFTRAVTTPSGGRHLFFKHPGTPLKNRVGIRPGIDIRADGGYVVAPPSTIHGRAYVHGDPCEAATAPAWLLELLPKEPVASVPKLRVPATHGIPTIREGERNDRLFRIARGCRADGYTEVQILERLRQLNRDGTVTPPVDDAELVTLSRQGALVPAGHGSSPTGERPEYHRTDLGNAQRLSDRHHGRIYWLTDSQSWLVWDGRRYLRDSGERVMQAAQETVTSLYLDAANCEDVAERKALGAYAAGCERESKLRASVSLARSQSSVMARSDTFDIEPDLLNVRNGTIHLSSGSLRSHDQGDRLTRLAPIDYDDRAACPTWETFLARIMDGNQELIEYLRRAVGYSLTGSTQEHCLFMLHGSGANGKSTFTETLCDMLGEYAMHTQFSTWASSERGEATHEIAALSGARMVVSNEAEGGVRFAEGLVKQATGGDRMRGCFKYQNSFEFTPSLKLWIALNHKPSVRGTDEGFWRRIRLIPFSVTIPPAERDPSLRLKLREELPGILAWAVRGAFEWYHHGLADPDIVKEATRVYRGDQDTFGVWIDECLVVSGSFSESGSALYNNFKAWCERQGMKPMANNKLANMLKDKGFTSEKNVVGRMEWKGFMIRPEGSGGLEAFPHLLL